MLFFYTEYVLPFGILHLNENHLPIEKVVLNKYGLLYTKGKNKQNIQIFISEDKCFHDLKPFI